MLGYVSTLFNSDILTLLMLIHSSKLKNAVFGDNIHRKPPCLTTIYILCPNPFFLTFECQSLQVLSAGLHFSSWTYTESGRLFVCQYPAAFTLPNTNTSQGRHSILWEHLISHVPRMTQTYQTAHPRLPNTAGQCCLTAHQVV